MFQHLNHKGTRRTEKARNCKVIWKTSEGELPQSGKGNRLPGSPGSSESPKEVGLKDSRKNTPRHIIITLAKIKDKERILKAAREKEAVTYKGVPMRLSSDFSKETLQARRGWKEIFKVIKGKDLHPRWLYPSKLSFRMHGQIKCFPDKVKGVYYHQALIIWNVKGTYLRKRRWSKIWGEAEEPPGQL